MMKLELLRILVYISGGVGLLTLSLYWVYKGLKYNDKERLYMGVIASFIFFLVIIIVGVMIYA